MNIELHGFLPEHAKDIGVAVWSKLLSNLPKEEFVDCAVTIVDDRAYDHNHRNAPFFRVFSDKKADFKLVAELLKLIWMPGAGMKTFVECILLNDCIELDSGT
ncbi:MAG: hypothetical protein WC648_02870 [Candidatus Paceibacterota bacterium]|jgi:hypothetical protein